MEYIISCSDAPRGYLSIQLSVNTENAAYLELQLPAWRPGRYEMANYARNIQKFRAMDHKGNILSFLKIKKDRWRISCSDASRIIVEYNYYARQMDAGGSYLDEDLIYINFINCLLYIDKQINNKCSVILDIPSHYTIACGHPIRERILQAESFYKLADSPLVAAPQIQSKSYTVKDTDFTIWLHGKINPDWPRLLSDFKKFTETQLELMGDFPEKDYHFLLFILPYPHYHGVEHANSTVITLGPDQRFEEKGFYDNLLGISSHELFHAWNICKIRPAELLPYDFSQEIYFETGYVAEGFTTYYGDLILARSGAFSSTDYFNELAILLKRHFENFGRFNRSLTESSVDLWVDGYIAGTPHRKVSIYVKGAVMALFIDLWIRRHSQGRNSLDDVMQLLWIEFGKKNRGYTSSDIFDIIKRVTGFNAQPIYDRYINGTSDEEEELNDLLNDIGCKLDKQPSNNLLERYYGLRVKMQGEKTLIDLIIPNSPADQVLSPGDEIVQINQLPMNTSNIIELTQATSNEICLVIQRNYIEYTYILRRDNHEYFPVYSIQKREDADSNKKAAFRSWLHQDF